MGSSRLRDLALTLTAATAGAGCASYGQHLSASPTLAGTRQLSLNADVLVIDRGFGMQVLPNPEVGYRVGLAEAVDIGGRVNAGSIELNARWRVLSAGVELTLVPGFGFGFVPVTNRDVGLFNMHLLGGALAGFRLGTRTQLIAGARGASTYAFPLTAFRGQTEEAYWLYLGGGVLGVRFPIGVSTYLLPEINLFVPYDTRSREWLAPTVQSGVAIQFD